MGSSTCPPRLRGGWPSFSKAGGSPKKCCKDSPRQKSKIFASPLINAGAKGASAPAHKVLFVTYYYWMIKAKSFCCRAVACSRRAFHSMGKAIVCQGNVTLYVCICGAIVKFKDSLATTIGPKEVLPFGTPGEAENGLLFAFGKFLYRRSKPWYHTKKNPGKKGLVCR